MIAKEHEADDAALGDARHIMDVVDAKGKNGRSEQDQRNALGKLERSQARDAHRATIRLPLRMGATLPNPFLALRVPALVCVCKTGTVALRRGRLVLSGFHVLVLRIRARHRYHVSQVIGVILGYLRLEPAASRRRRHRAPFTPSPKAPVQRRSAVCAAPHRLPSPCHMQAPPYSGTHALRATRAPRRHARPAPGPQARDGARPRSPRALPQPPRLPR